MMEEGLSPYREEEATPYESRKWWLGLKMGITLWKFSSAMSRRLNGQT